MALLLAANPQVRLVRPGNFLYDLIEAAELGEPGTMPALIDLKLSQSPVRRQGRRLQAGRAGSGSRQPCGRPRALRCAGAKRLRDRGRQWLWA